MSDSKLSPLDMVRMCAEVQRLMVWVTRDYVREAREQGASWSDIGRALEMVRETAFRQYEAGSPIVAVKPWQHPRT